MLCSSASGPESSVQLNQPSIVESSATNGFTAPPCHSLTDIIGRMADVADDVYLSSQTRGMFACLFVYLVLYIYILILYIYTNIISIY